MTATASSPTTRTPLPSEASSARVPEASVDRLFVDRWSPRAFTDDPVSESEVRTLFEAARWAPSAANEQPWLFVYARTPEDRERFAGGLVEVNRGWASHAPLLMFVFARKFSRDPQRPGQPVPSAPFDAGAAWMSLALQAELRGLSAHAMGGILREKVFEITGVPREAYDLLVGVAVGRRGAPSQLPEMLAARESPSPRLPQSEVAVEGRFGR